ncbi:ribosomal protection-like ABC-F family protein [Enterococcus sp. LJL90]
MIIQGNKLNKNFGGDPLFNELSITINQGAKIGLVGANGSGKSTLLKILAGEEGVDGGTVSRQKGIRISQLVQIQMDSNLTVEAYLLKNFTEIENVAQRMRHFERELANPQADFDSLLEKYGRLQQTYEELGGYTLSDRITTTLKGLGLGDKADVCVNQLSGGQRLRLELAKVLLTEADCLFLDEPTNHLDLAGIEWLENYLKNTKQSYVLISHDREFLNRTVNQIFEIEEGKLIDYPGNYERFIELKKARIAEIQKNFELQQKEILRLKKQIRQFRQWGHEGDNEDFFRKAKELERRLAKIEIIKAPTEHKNKLADVKTTKKVSKEILTVQDLALFGGEELLFSDANFTIFRGERVALKGANGSGKSTLIKAILNDIAADEGSVKLAASVKVGYLPQILPTKDSPETLLSYTQEFIGEEEKTRRKLAQFGFYATDVFKRVKNLSGGEQLRLALLEILQKEINFLIMDEPTNHLDIATREEIEEILLNYSGTLLLVSHDRFFLKKICQKELRIEAGTLIKFENYAT